MSPLQLFDKYAHCEPTEWVDNPNPSTKGLVRLKPEYQGLDKEAVKLKLKTPPKQ